MGRILSFGSVLRTIRPADPAGPACPAHLFYTGAGAPPPARTDDVASPRRCLAAAKRGRRRSRPACPADPARPAHRYQPDARPPSDDACRSRRTATPPRSATVARRPHAHLHAQSRRLESRPSGVEPVAAAHRRRTGTTHLWRNGRRAGDHPLVARRPHARLLARRPAAPAARRRRRGAGADTPRDKHQRRHSACVDA